MGMLLEKMEKRGDLVSADRAGLRTGESLPYFIVDNNRSADGPVQHDPGCPLQLGDVVDQLR